MRTLLQKTVLFFVFFSSLVNSYNAFSDDVDLVVADSSFLCAGIFDTLSVIGIYEDGTGAGDNDIRHLISGASANTGGGNLILKAPSGFEFNPSAVGDTFWTNPSGKFITDSSSLTVTKDSAIFHYYINNTNGTDDSIRILNLQVKAVSQNTFGHILIIEDPNNVGYINFRDADYPGGANYPKSVGYLTSFGAFLSNFSNMICVDDSTGNAKIDVNRGELPYTYVWSHDGGATSDSVSNLFTGGHTVQVTDNSGCSDTVGILISITGVTINVALVDSSDMTCLPADNSSGSATLTTTLGLAPYTYIWSHNGGISDSVATDLSAGTVTVIVTDANTCRDTINVTTSFFQKPTISMSSSSNPLCNGDANGTMKVSASGGSPGYTYMWSHDGGISIDTASNIPSGAESVVVNDTKLCKDTLNFNLTQPSVLQAVPVDTVDVTVLLGSDGSATVRALGGTAPYTYLWSDTAAQTDTIATNLYSTAYTATVTDTNGCVAVANFFVGQPGALTGGIIFSVDTIVCLNENPGQFTVTSPQNGTGVYAYTWESALFPFSVWTPIGGATDSFYNPPVVTQTIAYRRITKSGLETAFSNQLIITVETKIVNLSNVSTEYCASDPLSIFTGSPGSPAGVFTISPATAALTDNGDSTADFNPASSAFNTAYKVKYIYTSSETCNYIDSVNTIVHSLPAVTLDNLNTTYSDADADVLMSSTPIGGTFSGSGVTGSTFSPSTVGVGGPYAVVCSYTDGNSCTNTDTIFVTVTANSGVSFSSVQATYCQGLGLQSFTFSGPAPTKYLETLTITGGTGLSNINFAAGTADLNPDLLPVDNSYDITYAYYTGFYFVFFPVFNTVYTGYTTGTITINDINSKPSVSLSGVDTSGYCVDGGNAILTGLGTASGPGDTGIYTPLIGLTDFGNGTGVFDPAVGGAGSHTVRFTYTDANGCQDSATTNIVIKALPTLNISVFDSIYCIDGIPDTLIGLPIGGIFSGPGIEFGTNNFNPSFAGLGSKTITYSYTDPTTTCSNTFDSTTMVFGLPLNSSFAGLAPQYCESEEIDTFFGQIIESGTGLFTGNGINSINDTTASFDPTIVTPNMTHAILYTFTSDSTGCTSVFTQNVKVDTLPSVMFNKNTIDSVFCVDESAYNMFLDANPLGGVFFADSGVSGFNFFPNFAKAGTHKVTYSYTHPITTCVNSDTQQMIVNALPILAINNLAPEYCPNDFIDTLQGLPFGGTFSGIGISDSLLDPNVGATGVRTISYIYTDTNTCTNTFDSIITINQLPSFTINNLSSKYCINGDTSLINSVVLASDSGTGFFSGPGITSLGDTIAKFDPTVLIAKNNYVVSYQYTVTNTGCTVFDSQNVYIDSFPKISWLPYDTVKFRPLYCFNDAEFTIADYTIPGTEDFTTDVDPVFTGSGISGDKFFPSNLTKAEDGVIIDVVYFDGNGCRGDTFIIFDVKELPIVNFDVPARCAGIAIQFIDSTDFEAITSGNSIASWSWIFDDIPNSPNDTSALQNPVYTFVDTITPSFDVSLTVTSNFGCSVTNVIPQSFASPPQANFSTDNICYSDLLSDSIIFINSLIDVSDKVKRWEWGFGDGDLLIDSTTSDFMLIPEVRHRYASPGSYIVNLKVLTNGNCTDSNTIQVEVLPTEIIYDYMPYFTDFDSGSNGWFAKGDSLWELGLPQGYTINAAASGNNAWVTNLDTIYGANMNAWVESPCIDLSNINNPMISLDILADLDGTSDGAIIQYSIDFGSKWTTLGEINSGINWYNQVGINGDHGGIYLDGWSGEIGTLGDTLSSAQYVSARHILDVDSLKGASRVLLRIAFGTNNFNEREGFAFDNVKIQNRSKKILVEHFTNSSTSCFDCNEKEDSVLKFINRNNEDVIGILYHTDFPGQDLMNDANQIDVSSRAFVNGVASVPQTILDGNVYNGTPDGLTDNMVQVRVLEDAYFDVDINYNVDDIANILSTNVTVTALDSFSDNIALHIVVVEKQMFFSPDSFNLVMKKMLPSPGGTNISNNWVKGMSQIVNESWNIANVQDNSNLMVYAFIQSFATKEVYQANMQFNVDTSITSVNFVSNDKLGLSVYPNPANEKTSIVFEDFTTEEYALNIFNQLGSLVFSKVLNKNTKRIELATSEFASGVYYIELGKGELNLAREKLIVIRDKN